MSSLSKVIGKIKARVAKFDLSETSVKREIIANGMVQLNIICDDDDDDDDEHDSDDNSASEDNSYNTGNGDDDETNKKIHYWLIDLKHSIVLNRRAAKPDIKLEINKSDFLELGNRQLTLIDALAQGKIHISGNGALVAVFAEILLSL